MKFFAVAMLALVALCASEVPPQRVAITPWYDTETLCTVIDITFAGPPAVDLYRIVVTYESRRLGRDVEAIETLDLGKLRFRNQSFSFRFPIDIGSVKKVELLEMLPSRIATTNVR